MHQTVQKRDNDDDLSVASTREMGEGHHPRDQLLGCNLSKKSNVEEWFLLEIFK